MELGEVASQFYHLNAQALVLGSSLVGRVRLIAEGVESREVTISSLEGDIAHAQRKAITYGKIGVIEAVELSKVSSIVELKAFEEYSEALTLEVSNFYGKEFNLCKKQIKLRFLDLDIDDKKIDPDLAEEVDEGVVDGDAIWQRIHPWSIKTL
ncbi:hypothetical protein Acr_28g0006900 [Actinidia rufa]|uniref:Uncharacterized protein n=1 Tax=Actinidia rufa TaxID=165716 RepID=A0A7J0HAI3_9ERIC|nr:hypothetical protein Acr_28g0006900 [Actinidia rufa]